MYNVYSIVYLIISEMYLCVHACWLFVVHGHTVYLFYVVAWILINACESFMLNFELIIIRIQNQF
jgi:hypothetical protein